MSIFDKIYQINLRLAATRLMPPSKRSEPFIAWLGSLLQPLQKFHDDIFIDGNISGKIYRTEALQMAHYSARKIIFEAVLNKKFNVTSAPLIYIELLRNAARFNYFFNESENIPVYMFSEGELPDQPLYMWNESETIPNYNFIIYVPVSVWITLGENDTVREGYIRGVADNYNLDGIGYKVMTY